MNHLQSHATRRWSRAVAVFGTILLGSAVIGALLNAANALISSQYFILVMGWPDDHNLSRRIVGQGVGEALLYGAIAATAITIVVSLTSGFSIEYSNVLHRLWIGVPIICIGWIMGGAATLGLVLVDDVFKTIFPLVGHERYRAAWVSGAIVGSVLGGAVSCVACCILIVKDWRAIQSAWEDMADAGAEST